MTNNKGGIHLNRSGWRTVLQPYRTMTVQGLCFFFAAGTVSLPRAWFYFGIVFIGCLVSTYINLRFLKHLANIRGRPQEGYKKWDLVILLLYFIFLIIVLPVTAGVEMGRLEAELLDYRFMAVGLVGYLAAFAVIQWSMLVNRHFEGLVRIQTDRDHTIISEGPYRLIRHPGYLGMFVLPLSVPLILGSRWALIPALICVALLVTRTYLEDRTLQNELAGYADYAKSTRYRLIPGIW